MALPPHWLDGVIDDVIESGDPAVVAQAIANSPQVIGAITVGLKEAAEAKKAQEERHMVGAGPAQIVRRRVVAAIEATT